MTSEEKDLIQTIHNESMGLKKRDQALKRIGEILEETFILDLLPDKGVLHTLEKISISKSTHVSLKRRANTLLKAYKI